MAVWKAYHDQYNASAVYIKDLIGENLEYLDHRFFTGKKSGKEEALVHVIHHKSDDVQVPALFFVKSVVILNWLHVLERSIEKGEKVHFRLTYDTEAKPGQTAWGIEPVDNPFDYSHDNISGETPSDIPF